MPWSTQSRERMGLPRSEVSTIEERVPSLVERIATALRMSTPEVTSSR